MNTTAYLERINYQGSITPTAQTLKELQLAHLLTVPFENLSIHWNEPIVLDDDALFEKIVTRKRGGFCYELNGLFAALLRSLGFNVAMLSAGVAIPDGGFGPDFDHMTLMVTLNERWLADVGFGDSFLEPLLLDNREEQIQGERAYILVPDGTHFILNQRDALVRHQREDLIDNQPEGLSGNHRDHWDDWKSQYRVDLQPHVYADYLDMCSYQETSPQSHFTQSRICSRATPEGRITLSDLRFITTVGPERRERTLSSSAKEYATILREYFGIE